MALKISRLIMKISFWCEKSRYGPYSYKLLLYRIFLFINYFDYIYQNTIRGRKKSILFVMETANSPLFPALRLTFSPGLSTDNLQGSETPSLIPQLPDKPLTQTSSIQVYIVPAEKTLFTYGFEPNEYAERPPTLLRGCLVVRVLKPSKIKSITLLFKGKQRTDWPEGIPPKKNIHMEVNDVVSHTWPFFQAGSTAVNGGADEVFRELPKTTTHDSDVTNLSLTDTITRSLSPSRSETGGNGNFFGRNLSPVTSLMRKSHSQDTGFNDLNTVLTNSEGDQTKSGNFAVGDYVYNFEHPLHPSIPESTSVTFGSVCYYLEVDIVRMGTFKFNISGQFPIEIVRLPSEMNMEENDPIVIARDWEDQLRYEIVISGKSIVLNSYLPMAFRFVPLWGKVQLHRIRVYVTESLEYYCQNNKVHRLEPQKKFLLLEHRAAKGKSLLSKNVSENDNEDEEEVLPKELEFQLYVPEYVTNKQRFKIHPDTSYETIQSHHWIKICLRISRVDPENSEKRKHYEILIDSPIHILSPLAAHGNTLLPAYDNILAEPPTLPIYSPTSPPLSPGVIPVQELAFRHINAINNNDEPIERDPNMHLEANLYQPDESVNNKALNSPQAVPHPGTFNQGLSSPMERPIHLLRKPSFNPPSFEETQGSGPSKVLPPAYEEREFSLSPLRIDESSERNSNKGVNLALPGNVPVLTTPIKDLLHEQLRKLSSSPSRKSASSDNHSSLNEEYTKNLNPLSAEEDDDLGNSPILSPRSMSPQRSESRRSSVISIESNTTNLPVEQTLPLLNVSSASLTPYNPEPGISRSRNSSSGSLLPDVTRRPSQARNWSTRITDIVDNYELGDDLYKINGNLSLLRNPRIKRHYQKEEIGDPATVNEPAVTTKLRQKSFGVVNDLTECESSKSQSSTESDMTIGNEDQLGHTTRIVADLSGVKSESPIPGFNLGYEIK
ncbi:uncharacterized protein PRCAT00003286001 [Priceomyces carsonii]|uniref:uncharacterized protein n=1 Tax=Priceomyces carsonii TaxID=28549 RepID=UPI002ED7ADF0|nr:unnamed protein product [Priceomyces carsonii]